MVAVALAGAALVLCLGACGSGDGEEASGDGRVDRQAPEATLSGPVRAGVDAHRQDAGNAAAPREPERAEPGAEPHRSPRHVETSRRSAGACPNQPGRAECLANLRASRHSTPGRPVDDPRQCLRVASRAQCAKIAEDELAASDQADRSFRPEECLRYYSRAQCAALLDSQMPR